LIRRTAARTLAAVLAVCAGIGAAATTVDVQAQVGAHLSVSGPVTGRHYAPNRNFRKHRHVPTYVPGKLGFNLADVSSVQQLDSLPAGVEGLVYLGLCNGADGSFIEAVRPFIGKAKLYGFYLIDEPDPTGSYKALCPALNLKAEADWIRANAPGVKTFIVLMSLGTSARPEYMNTYNSANTDIELFGLDPYPCSRELRGCNYSVIDASVIAAQAAGIEAGQIVPVYQAFGGGRYKSWTLPSAAEEEAILARWAARVPAPAFDFAYSWGRQAADHALEDTSALQTVFAAHNGS
jgi:hypothetical protein